MGAGPRSRFDFAAWAHAARFDFSERALPMLERLGSPAEAYFIRRLFQSEATIFDGERVAHCRGMSVWVQQPCGPYWIDVVAQSNRTQLAIEIDGMQHWSSKAQITADYIRERRLLRAGYIVMRFTASEVIGDPGSAWRDVFAVLAARRSLERSA